MEIFTPLKIFLVVLTTFIVMLLAIYVPETKVIGQGLDYNLVP